ncbi:hypothetical protein ACQ4LE_009285 [Meloidogyne hapla]|uniref:Uncharacterized protein n=1 Tax=Meloidogyne hapla TaxID=6305 RepID=A0A1I8BWB8_MELHA
MFTEHRLADLRFWPEDVENAEKFLDEIFPEVRQLFKLKYEEIEINKKQFNNGTIDLALEEFMEIQANVDTSMRKTTGQSSFALHGNYKSKCYKKN